MPDPRHRLEPLDHAVLRMLQAAGREQLMQSVWVYERPVDRAGLERFHRNFGESSGNRLIEESPLRFARPRWVRPAGPLPPLLVGEPRPRSELLDWADGLGQLTIDPVRGPSWRLALQPFTDGTAAVSMIGSHAIGDGVLALMAVYAAITGTMRAAPYDMAGTRTRREALSADAAQVLADLPRTARAVPAVTSAVVAALRSRRGDPAAPAAPAAPAGDTAADTVIAMPTAAVLLATADWDARAKGMSGNPAALLAAVAARLGQSLGRVRATDGTVTLQLAVSRRTGLVDDRAIAMEFARASIDPVAVVSDLAPTRAALRESRSALGEQHNGTLAMLPVVPWLPQRAMRRAPDLLFSFSEELPVACSNLGDLVPELACVDGTPADHLVVRGLDAHVTLADLERSRGHLVVVAGRIGGQVCVSAESWELGADNSRARLRALLDAALADFGLRGAHL